MQKTHEVTASVRYQLQLEGGPDDLRPECAAAGIPSAHVKLPWLGGYEHYLFSGQHRVVGEQSLPVFRWVYRTTLAE